MSDASPSLPIYVLVDHDPDGIAILSTYKYGSLRLAHEHLSKQDNPGLDLPQARWLGVRSHDISKPGEHVPQSASSTSPPYAQGLMKLTPRDRTKAMQMLTWTMCAEQGSEPEWRRELQTMLMLNLKAEIQILDEVDRRMGAWVGRELGVKQGSRRDESDPAAAFASDDELLF